METKKTEAPKDGEPELKKNLQAGMVNYKGERILVSTVEMNYLQKYPQEIWPFALAWFRAYNNNTMPDLDQFKDIFIMGWNSAVYMKAEQFVQRTSKKVPIKMPKTSLIGPNGSRLG